jgi:hypothetical protein
MGDKSKQNDMVKILIERSLEPMSTSIKVLSQYKTADEVIENAVTDENLRNCKFLL